MMKKRIARSAKALIFIVAAALLFSGFTTAGGTRLEKEAAKDGGYAASYVSRRKRR